ncbi:hypothetical protein ACJMK2_028198 [Sinanodonta woodiana]|uniref:Peptidylglycine monooxygenase n=1 Tax=Sinanodonta woodiana TaxID=1069815 RepID=A0ABD3X7Z5_SINWO
MGRRVICLPWYVTKVLIFVLIRAGPIEQNSPQTNFDVVSEKQIQMSKIRVEQPDSYMCIAVPFNDLETPNLVGFQIEAIRGLIHHVAVAVCEEYESNETIWDCKNHQGHLCSGRSIAFGGWDGWSQHHSKMMFPNDVAVTLGKNSKLNYVIVQAHFKDAVPDIKIMERNPTNVTLYMTRESRRFSYQQVLFFSSGYIPPFSEDFKAEMMCKWEGITVHVFEYSVHTHDHGILVEGYVVRNNTAILLVKQSPKGKHHDKTRLSEPFEIRSGDILAGRCTFRNMESHRIKFGLGGADEMCNLDLAFKYDSTETENFPRAIKCSADVQEHVWCPNGSSHQNNVLCGLH